MKDILEYKFWDELKALPFIERIWLFGSRAKGENATRADLDIAIDCPAANQEQWLSLLEVVENADTLLKIDCIRFDKLKDSDKLKENIIKERELIYSKDD